MDDSVHRLSEPVGLTTECRHTYPKQELKKNKSLLCCMTAYRSERNAECFAAEILTMAVLSDGILWIIRIGTVCIKLSK